MYTNVTFCGDHQTLSMGLVRERGNFTPVIELQMWYPLLGYFNLSHSNVENNATFDPLWDKIYALNVKYLYKYRSAKV